MATTKQQIIDRLNVSEARAALEGALKREQGLIKKRNAEFKALPDRKKRIVIAQDVLNQLATKRIVPTFGTYLEVSYEHRDRFDLYSDKYDKNTKVNEALSNATCEACGIGSLFVAAVDRANACVVGDMQDENDDNFMREYLNEWFDQRQLTLIEAAFEGRIIDNNEMDYDDEEVKRAIRFTKDVKTPTGRLKKIMGNIVKTGSFVP